MDRNIKLEYSKKLKLPRQYLCFWNKPYNFISNVTTYFHPPVVQLSPFFLVLNEMPWAKPLYQNAKNDIKAYRKKQLPSPISATSLTSSKTFCPNKFLAPSSSLKTSEVNGRASTHNKSGYFRMSKPRIASDVKGSKFSSYDCDCEAVCTKGRYYSNGVYTAVK